MAALSTGGRNGSLRDALAPRANGSGRGAYPPAARFPTGLEIPGDGFLTIAPERRSGGISILRVVADRVLLEFRAQGLARDAQHRGGARLVALAHAQRVLDRHLLQLGERADGARGERVDRGTRVRVRAPHRSPARVAAHLGWEVLGADLVVGLEQQHALDDVPKLAHVARPAISLK